MWPVVTLIKRNKTNVVFRGNDFPFAICAVTWLEKQDIIDFLRSIGQCNVHSYTAAYNYRRNERKHYIAIESESIFTLFLLQRQR